MKTVNCNVYRCSKHEEMYLYLHEDKTPADLPDTLIALVKNLTQVMELKLTPARKLAREDVLHVMKNLQTQGYHLQLPPNSLKPDMYQGD